MSYVYRERDRDRDFDDREHITIKRYVVPSEERDDRREFTMNRDDYADRELVIRRHTDREEPVSIHRYERDVEYDPPARRYEREYYEPRYVSSRQSEYEVDEDYYRRRVVDDRHPRRDVSPGDSVSQATRRRGRRDNEYSSDDEYYYHEETRTYDGDRDHPHHRRHLAEGALVGVGAAELLRGHRKREGEEVSHGMSHAMKTAGAGALGAVAVNAASHVRDYYRSKSRSRHRSHSFDDDRSHRYSHHSGRHSKRHSRSRSRSKSHSRAKTLMEVGLGAAAIAAGVAALRNKKGSEERRSRSRTRSRSRAAGSSTAPSGRSTSRSMSQRRKHMASAGLAGAAVASLVEHHRSKSRSRKGERSHSRLRKALPVVAAGLGTAAATGLWEKNKAEKEEKEDGSGRSRSKSRSRGTGEVYPDPTRDSAGLIEYGKDPVTGSIPAEHYYGAPNGADRAYYSDGAGSSRRPSRSRSRSRGVRYSGSSSGSDRESHRRRRKHRSRSRDLAGAALGATGLGYAAHKYSQSRERKKAEQREREQEQEQDRTRYDEGTRRDGFTESPNGYEPAGYSASPAANFQHPQDNYYPNTNSFPPPPASTSNLNVAQPNSYNPAEYPPPPGAAPQPQAYNYGAPGPGTEQYAPRPRRADENVSAPRGFSVPTDPHTRDVHTYPEMNTVSILPLNAQRPESPLSKSVSFQLQSPGSTPTPRAIDHGYETDDNNSSLGSLSPSHHHSHHRRRRSSSVPHARSHDHHSIHTHARSSQPRSSIPTAIPKSLSKAPETDSDSTIDLPERFDKHGRLLDGHENHSTTAFEDLIDQVAKIFL
ncbi:hypothetical protein N7528_006088 [Penicillium herquei]|nr:hypothetical protein N7528_006088 [Penicillium herquei]